MLLATTFWETFFLFLIFMPLFLLWASALLDIFRRDDLRGTSKALWVAAVILVPFFGTLMYLVFRPVGATPEERAMIDDATPQLDSAAQLKLLAELHDRGKLTDQEFDAEKARVLGAAQKAPEAPGAPMTA